MFIPGFIISILTFPGVIVHEFAHQFFCWLYGVPVKKVVYFQFANPSGYVVHEPTETDWQNIMIGTGPFVVNTIIGAVIALPAALPVFTFHNASPLDYILIWLGVSIVMHAFPSTGDAKSIWASLKQGETTLLAKIIGYPIIGIIYLSAAARFFWFDFIYASAVCVGLPKLLVAIFA